MGRPAFSTSRTQWKTSSPYRQLARMGPHLERLGLQPDGYVLFMGRFSPGKNCHLLIEAFDKTNTPLKLALAGGSSHTDDYVASIRKCESERISRAMHLKR